MADGSAGIGRKTNFLKIKTTILKKLFPPNTRWALSAAAKRKSGNLAALFIFFFVLLNCYFHSTLIFTLSGWNLFPSIHSSNPALSPSAFTTYPHHQLLGARISLPVHSPACGNNFLKIMVSIFKKFVSHRLDVTVSHLPRAPQNFLPAIDAASQFLRRLPAVCHNFLFVDIG